jgi:hypothetical protein
VQPERPEGLRQQDMAADQQQPGMNAGLTEGEGQNAAGQNFVVEDDEVIPVDPTGRNEDELGEDLPDGSFASVTTDADEQDAITSTLDKDARQLAESEDFVQREERRQSLYHDSVYAMVRGVRPPDEFVEEWMNERMATAPMVPGAAPGSATKDAVAQLLTENYLLKNALSYLSTRWPSGFMRIDASDMRSAAQHTVEISRAADDTLLLSRVRMDSAPTAPARVTREQTGDPMDPPEQRSRREREMDRIAQSARERPAAFRSPARLL